MKRWQTERGGVTLEALLEFLLVLIIVPPLVTCAIQAVLALANIILPWAALVVIVFIIASALTIVVSVWPRSRERLETGLPDDLPLLPPIDRPKAPRWQREDEKLR